MEDTMRLDEWSTIGGLALLAMMGLGCAADAPPAYDTTLNAATGSGMSEEGGCRVLNKGKRGQVCYYDVTRHRPEKAANAGLDAPIRISERLHETVLWHQGDGLRFHITGLELRPGQNPNC